MFRYIMYIGVGIVATGLVATISYNLIWNQASQQPVATNDNNDGINEDNL